MSERDRLQNEAAAQSQIADRAENEAAQAERERTETEARSRANPPLATRDELKQATENALQKQRAATRERSAANTAMNALNAYDLDQVKHQIAAAQASLDAARQLNGIDITTDFNFEESILHNSWVLVKNAASIRITGGGWKVSLGGALTLIFGMKGEFVFGIGKHTLIWPREWKHIIGAQVNIIAGVKKDTIMGAKWDEVVGGKYESHVGVKITKGPNSSELQPREELAVTTHVMKYEHLVDKEKDKEEEVGTKGVKIDEFLEKVTKISRKITDMQEKFSKLERILGEAKRRIDHRKLKCSGYCGITARSSAWLKGDFARVSLGYTDAELSKGRTSMKVGPAQVVLEAGTKIKVL